MKILHVGKDKLTGSDRPVRDAFNQVEESIKYLNEKERAKVAIELLRDLNENFLIPLREAVGNYAETIRGQRKNTSEHKYEEFPEFPASTKAEVSSRYKPPTTEQSLIDFKKFPELLEKWGQEAVQAEQRSNYRQVLIKRAALGKRLDETGDSDVQTAIKTLGEWIPQNSDFKVSGFPQKASFEINLGVRDLFQNSRTLLHERGGQLSVRVNMGLREYVENVANEGVKKQLQDEFMEKFNTALESAQPLIQQNETVLNTLHESKPKFFVLLSTIPFQGTGLKDEIAASVDSWAKRGGNSGMNKEEMFSAASGISEIIIFCASNASSPMVFDSVMKPIHADWTTRKRTYQGRAGFWKDRRTKPFIEAIPAAREQIVKMIEGWIVLGLTENRVVEDLHADRGGPKAKAYHFDDQEWYEFPHPLLGCPEKPTKSDHLPAVLASLSIAMLDLNDKGADLKPLKAYHALLEAGHEETQKEIFNEYLSRGKNGESNEKGVDKLLETINKEIETLNKKIFKWESEVNIWGKGIQYELREEWLSAFHNIKSVLESVKLGSEEDEELG